MESFYGGRPGASFVIVKSFVTVAEMIASFKQGPNYTDVHFDEYILIDTANKADIDNGKIYRRGYDYSNTLGGAIYVGKISGPPGPAPILELTTYQNVKDKGESEEGSRYAEGEYTVPSSMVPGKDSQGNFNDVVTWASCCVRSEDGLDSTAYIGFKFPYTVIEIEGASVDPYYNRSNNTANFINKDLTIRTDNLTHPFYQKWDIKIPKGIKGDSFSNFRVIPADSSIQNYEGREDDIENNREILVYTYQHFDRQSGGEPVNLYLGDFNMIKNIDMDDEGTITITYTHDDDKVFENTLKWIESVELDSQTGHFTVIYNQLDEEGHPTKYETDLSWIKDITITDTGVITKIWSTGETEELSTILRWIEDVDLSNEGTLTIDYNTGQPDTFINKIRWITGFTLANDGTVTVDYNYGSSDVWNNKLQWITEVSLTDKGKFTIKFNNENEDYVTTLKWLKDITIDEDGSITFVYNDDTTVKKEKFLKTLKKIVFDDENSKFKAIYNTGEEELIDQVIKFIDEIYLNDSEEGGDYLFHVKYNNGEDVKLGKDMVNNIKEIAIDERDYHLIVYYTNARIREVFPPEKTRIYNNQTGWVDLGSVKEDSGILVGLNVPLSAAPDLDNISSAIAYLNSLYPQGLTELKYKGKIITIGDAGDNKTFYAFDYDINSWYYLGTFENSDLWVMVGAEDDPATAAQKDKLSIGGVWFVVEGEDGY